MLIKVFHDTQDAMREYGLSHVPDFGKVVEVGCGDAKQTAPCFIGKPKRYVGIDNQLHKIQIAEETFPCLTFVCADCLSMKGKKIVKKADTLISFQTLEHLGTPKGNEDLRLLGLLKEGIKIIISVPNFPSRYHVRFYDHSVWTKRLRKVMDIEELCIYHSIKPYGIIRQRCSYLYIGYKI